MYHQNIPSEKPELLIVSVKTKSADAWSDRKSTRLNSSHANISYAVFCLKKKKTTNKIHTNGLIQAPISCAIHPTHLFSLFPYTLPKSCINTSNAIDVM